MEKYNKGLCQGETCLQSRVNINIGIVNNNYN